MPDGDPRPPTPPKSLSNHLETASSRKKHNLLPGQSACVCAWLSAGPHPQHPFIDTNGRLQARSIFHVHITACKRRRAKQRKGKGGGGAIRSTLRSRQKGVLRRNSPNSQNKYLDGPHHPIPAKLKQSAEGEQLHCHSSAPSASPLLQFRCLQQNSGISPRRARQKARPPSRRSQEEAKVRKKKDGGSDCTTRLDREEVLLSLRSGGIGSQCSLCCVLFFYSLPFFREQAGCRQQTKRAPYVPGLAFVSTSETHTTGERSLLMDGVLLDGPVAAIFPQRRRSPTCVGDCPLLINFADQPS